MRILMPNPIAGEQREADVWSPARSGVRPGLEPSKAGLEYGFSELGLEKVFGLTAEQNYGSIRILEKLGFKFQEKFLFNNIKAFKYFYTGASKIT